MPTITVNGENRAMDKEKSVLEFLDELGVSAKKVVVEHNRNILQRTQLDQIILKDGDVLEIVHFVGGG